MTTQRTLFTLTITALLTACGGDPATERGQSRAASYHESSARDREEGSRPPRIGMTKDQVLNMYGEPTDTNISSRGEKWVYVFNNFDAHSFIPYYGAYHDATKRRHSGTVIFGSDGRVKDFNWNESNPRGATIWR